MFTVLLLVAVLACTFALGRSWPFVSWLLSGHVLQVLGRNLLGFFGALRSSACIIVDLFRVPGRFFVL